MVGPGTAQRNGVTQAKAFDGVTAKVAAAEDLSATLAVGWEAFQFIAIVADYYAGRVPTGFAEELSRPVDGGGGVQSVTAPPGDRIGMGELGQLVERVVDRLVLVGEHRLLVVLGATCR